MSVRQKSVFARCDFSPAHLPCPASWGLFPETQARLGVPLALGLPSAEETGRRLADLRGRTGLEQNKVGQICS